MLVSHNHNHNQRRQAHSQKMQRKRRHPKYNPERDPDRRNRNQIAQTRTPNIQPTSPRVSSIDLVPVWSREALHAVVAGAQKYGAESIDNDMSNDIDRFHLGAISAEELASLLVGGITNRETPYRHAWLMARTADAQRVFRRTPNLHPWRYGRCRSLRSMGRY